MVMSDTPKKFDNSEALTALEVIQREQGKRIDALSYTVEKLTIEIHDGISKISKEVAAAQKTPWPTLASWATVVILLIGAIISPFIRDLTKLETTQSIFQTSLEKHKELDGHKPTTQRLGSLESSVEHLDANLQREMRLLDETTNVRIANLDEMLQREMQLNIKPITDRLSILTEEIKLIRGWQDHHREESARSNERQDAQIEALIRENSP